MIIFNPQVRNYPEEANEHLLVMSKKTKILHPIPSLN